MQMENEEISRPRRERNIHRDRWTCRRANDAHGEFMGWTEQGFPRYSH